MERKKKKEVKKERKSKKVGKNNLKGFLTTHLFLFVSLNLQIEISMCITLKTFLFNDACRRNKLLIFFLPRNLFLCSH